MTTSAQPSHLEPSELGTKQYWDSLYTTEIENHAVDPSDTGTAWFSESAAEEKILEYLRELDLRPESTTFLDLGAGNGHLLFEVKDDGWAGRMVGVDYSEKAVELARGILRQTVENSDGECGGKTADIVFERWDIVREAPGSWLEEGGFDVVLDKGTFDAISLSEDVDPQGKRIVESYAGKVLALIKPDGFLLVTSCNWTAEELRGWFQSEDLRYHGTIKYPSYTFGGRKGQTISSVCFRKAGSPS